MYLILRHDFKNNLLYKYWGDYYVNIDESLNYNKTNIIKNLMNSPNDYSEYLNLGYNEELHSENFL